MLFQEQGLEVQNAITQYVGGLDPQLKKEVLSKPLDEKRKAELAERATLERLKAVSRDIDILVARVELSTEPYSTELMLLGAERSEARDQGRVEDVFSLEQQIDSFAGTDEYNLLQAYERHGDLFNAYMGVIAKYPEEFKRRKEIEFEREKIKVKDGDSLAVTGSKILRSTGASIKNKLMDAVVGLATTSKALSDVVQRDVLGNDISTYAPSDRVIDGLTDFFDKYKGVTDNQLLDDKGNIRSGAILPALAGTMTDMAVLLYGANKLGGGNAGIAASGMINSYTGFYKDALEKGLTESEALNYGMISAMVQGGLEVVSPNNAVRGLLKAKELDELGKRVVDGTNFRSVSKMVLNEIGAENLQEFTQGLGEVAVNRIVNNDLGKKVFKEQSDAKEIYETFLLTTAATALMMGTAGVKGMKSQEKQAIELLKENKDGLQEWLEEQRGLGNISLTQAQTAWDKVTNDVFADPAKSTETSDESSELLQEEAVSPATETESTVESSPEAAQEVDKDDFSSLVEAEVKRSAAQTPTVGQSVTVDGNSLQIQEVAEDQITLVDEAGNQSTITPDQYSTSVAGSFAYDTSNLTTEQVDLAKRLATMQSVEDSGSTAGTGIEVDINTQGVEFKAAPDFSESANNVVKALQNFGSFQVFTHKNTASLQQELDSRGIQSEGTASGVRIGTEIHLVEDQDSNTTLFHEGVHPVIDAAIQYDKPALDSLYDELTQMPEYNDAGIKEHEGRYEGDIAKKEAITEFIAKVASGEIKSENVIDRVRNFFNNLLTKLGLRKDQVDVSTDQGLRQFANSVARAMRSGTQINMQQQVETDQSTDPQFRLSEDSKVLKARTVAAEFASKIGDGLSRDFLSDKMQKHLGVTAEQAEAAIEAAVQTGAKPRKERKEATTLPGKAFQYISTSMQSFHSKYLSAKRGAPAVVGQLKDTFNGSLEVETDRVNRLVKEAKRLQKKHKIEEDVVDEYLRGNKEVDIPNNLRDVLDDMRYQIDSLSQYLLDKGYAYGDNKDIVAANIGSYMSRVYRIFVDPNYKPSDKVKLEAAKYYASQLTEKYEKAFPEMSAVERHDLALKEGQAKVEDILTEKEINFGGKSGSGRDSGIMKERNEDLAKEVKDLLGEYTSPYQAYAWTVYKLSNLAYGSKFLSDLQSVGLGKFMFVKGDAATEAKRGELKATYKIAGKGSETMWPLNIVHKDGKLFEALEDGDAEVDDFNKRDIYTTKEVYDALVESERNFQSFEEKTFKTIEQVLLANQKGGLATANSWINWMKTVASPATHMKNVFGNVPFMMSNGHINPLMLKFDAVKGVEAFRQLRQDLGLTYANREGSTAEQRAASVTMIEKLKAKGVVGQNIALRVIRDLTGKEGNPLDMIEGVVDSTANGAKKVWQKTGKAVGKKLDELYSMEDDYFKLLSFMLEADQYSKAIYGKKYKDLTTQQQAEVENISAEIVKNTLPNYSKLGKAAKSISRSIVVGNFIAFRAESFRVAYNSIAQGVKEIKSPNKKVQAIGASRLIGNMQVAALRAGIVGALGQMAGVGFQGVVGAAIDDEEEQQRNKDLRMFVYPWLKNGDLFVQSLENGKGFVYHAGGVDPYAGIQDMINVALLEDEDKRFKVVVEFGKGFLSETILSNAITNAKAGEDNYGNRIWYPSDSAGDKLYNSSMFLMRMASPGALNTALKIHQKDYDPRVIIGQFTGVTPYPIDIAKSFRMQLGKTFTDQSSGVRSKLNNQLYKLKNDEEMSSVEKDKQLNRINTELKEELDKVKKMYDAAIRLGVEDRSRSKEGNLLKSLSKDHQRYIRGGAFKGYDLK